MEDEKKISAPKTRKFASATKKTSAVKKNVENPVADKQSSEDFKTDSVGEVKPARKTKDAADKPAAAKKKSAPAAKPKTGEDAKITETYEAESSKRKTKAKATTKDSAAPAKKTAAKSLRRKTAKPAIVAGEELPVAGEKTKLLPQSKTSFKLEKVAPAETKDDEPEKVENTEIESEDPLAGKSPVFRELAAPKLPDLQPENRAWLQMQSPTRIFFYWSLKTNPFETLQKVFGGRNSNYTLSVKLQNLTNETEKIYPLAPYGSAWFDVEADSTYRAEVGFFDERRPFIRLVFSNTLETPRLTPSPRADRSPRFATTTGEFSEVLDVSGYKQDAFELALAGDDPKNSNRATFEAFEQITGDGDFEIDPVEMRLVLFALAAGASLENLRERISAKLFAYLERLMRENAARLSMENILAALQKNFGLESLESTDEPEEISYSVVGASRINFQKFPKQFWRKIQPISSFKVSR